MFNPGVSIPGLYAMQQGLVGSGLFDLNQPQHSPEQLQALSLMALSGSPGAGGGGGTPGFGNGGRNGLTPVQAGSNAPIAGGQDRSGYGGSGWGPGGSGREMGPGSGAPGAYDRGISGGFGPGYDLTQGNGSNWQDQFNLYDPLGTMTGLNIAENGKLIGNGIGLLTGLPGLGTLGGWLGNQYINNHTFMSPANYQTDLDRGINEFLNGPDWNPQQSAYDPTVDRSAIWRASSLYGRNPSLSTGRTFGAHASGPGSAISSLESLKRKYKTWGQGASRAAPN